MLAGASCASTFAEREAGLRCAHRGSHVLELVVVPILGHDGNAFTEVIRLEHSQLLILPSLRLLQAQRTRLRSTRR